MKVYYVNSLKIHDISTSDSLGYALHTPVDGIDMPTLRVGQQERPLQYGTQVPAQLYGGRSVTLNGIVWGASVSDHYGRRRGLEAAVSIIRSNYNAVGLLHKFTTDDNLDLQFVAFLQTFSLPDLYLNHSDFTSTFLAEDPRLYSQTQHSHDVALGSDSVSNAGSMITPPLLEFIGPLTNPRLTQTDLSQVFKIDTTIASGHSVIVDIAANTMVLDGSTNYNQYFDGGNIWWQLLAGTNHLNLSADSGSGKCNVKWRDAYSGT